MKKSQHNELYECSYNYLNIRQEIAPYKVTLVFDTSVAYGNT